MCVWFFSRSFHALLYSVVEKLKLTCHWLGGTLLSARKALSSLVVIYATVGLTPGERRQIGFGTMNPIRHHRLAKDARQANTRTTGISQT